MVIIVIYFRDVILTFDAMSIQPSLRYDRRNDEIVGFEDLGEFHSLKGMKEVANLLFVLMIRSIGNSWRQPIGYCLLKNGTSAENIMHVLLQVLYKLNTIDIRVKV